MIREICKDEFFLSQKSEPATADDLARLIGYTRRAQGWLRGHGGEYDWRQQAHHRVRQHWYIHGHVQSRDRQKIRAL